MTQLATPETVLGDFRGTSFGDAPYYRLERAGDAFVFGKAELRERPLERHPITLVTGSHHMQIYWYETGDTRKLGQVPLVWSNADQRWVRGLRCFSSRRRPRADPMRAGAGAKPASRATPRTDSRASATTPSSTRASPSSASRARRVTGRASSTWPTTLRRSRGIASTCARASGRRETSCIRSGSIIGARRRSAVSATACGRTTARLRCARATSTGRRFGPAWTRRTIAGWCSLRSARTIPRVAPAMEQYPSYVAGQFWSDGMARVSGREFSGIIDSPCFVSGELSCLSCHTMHQAPDDARALTAWANDQLGRDMDGDQACTQCHPSFVDPQTRTAHTRHSRQSDGSRCYNCHMPNTSYGLLKAMRTHRISVPSARETLETGRPNACNLCHLDKSLGWTAAKLRERYGIESPELPPDARDLPLALWMGLTGDAGQRALIAAALGWAPAHEASRSPRHAGAAGRVDGRPVRCRALHGCALVAFAAGLNAASLGYDFVPRPNTRPPIAPRVAALTQLSADDRARLNALFARLLPTRDQRAVVLLE